MIKITPIGSCRVKNPLLNSNQDSLIELNLQGLYGYTHTSAEALQQLRYLQGEYIPTEAVKPVLYPTHALKNEKLIAEPSDLYFVEISSAKNLLMGDEYIQLNYFTLYFSELLLDQNLSKKLWLLANEENKDQLVSFLESEPIYNSYSKDKQELLKTLTVKQTSEVELQRDMIEIMNRLENVVFITHCNARLPDNRRLQGRSSWIKLVEDVGKNIKATVYNPTRLTEAFGQSLAMKKQGFDLTHYTPAFEGLLFKEWHSLYMKPLLKAKGNLDAAIASAANYSPDAETEKLNELYRRGELAVALRHIYSLLREHPDNAKVREFLGGVLHDLGDYEGAIYHLSKLDTASKLSDNGRLHLIKSHFNIKQFAEVLVHAKLLFTVEQYDTDIIRLAAMAAQALGSYEIAAVYWEQLYQFEHFKLEAAINLGTIFERIGNYKLVIKWISEALKSNPYDLTLLSALNRACEAVADEKVLEDLIQALSYVSVEEMLHSIKSALKHGFVLTAAKGLIKANESWPKNRTIIAMIKEASIEWLQLIDNQNFRRRKRNQWINTINALLLIQPKNGKVIRIQRELILKHIDILKRGYKNASYEEIINERDQIFKLNPQFPGIDYLVGRACYFKKYYAEALSALIQATQWDSTNLKIWVLRSRAAIKSENYIEALFTLNEIKLNFGANAPATIEEQRIFVLSRALTKAKELQANGDLESAWKLNAAVLLESTQNEQALKINMLILRKMNKKLQNATNEKIAIAQSIYEKDNDNVQALKVLAIESMRQKKFAESLIYWDKLSYISPEVASFKQQRQKCLVAVNAD